MIKKYKLVLAGIVSILVVLGVSLYKYAMNSPFRISSAEAKKKIAEKKFDSIVDVRTQVERDTLGFYPKSLHIPSNEIEQKAASVLPDKKAHILVYCNTGQRARSATEKLNALGYKNIQYIAGPHTTLL